MSKTEGAGAADGQGRAETPVIRSETLLSTRKEAVIEHRGERYLLRETSRGKLILTK
jgi:hemin uptake protein HemP